MTPAARGKYENVFHLMTWLEKHLQQRIALLSSSDGDMNLGARRALESVLRLLHEKRRDIITTKTLKR